MHNLFRGAVEHSEVFPYPLALNQEQTDHIAAFVDPMTKFFVEVNDAAKNDENAVNNSDNFNGIYIIFYIIFIIQGSR